MDDRHKQLVAAAEALRTWVYAQRAVWAQGYPQTLVHAHRPFVPPPLVTSGAVALAVSLPAPFVPDVETMTASADSAEPGPSAWQGVTAAAGSTASSLRRFWPAAAAILVVALAGLTARSFWPGARAKGPSNTAASRDANKAKENVNNTRSAKPAASETASVQGTGRLEILSNPVGAHVLVDGRDRGVTPLTIEGLPAGSHKVVIRGDDGSLQRTVKIAAGESAQLNEAIYSGWLRVSAPIEVQLSEGRKAITLDDSNQVLLPPGPHEIRFENRALGVREVRRVDIHPGETTAISLESPVSRLTVTASEPAKVSIDGEAAGETPLNNFVVRVGTRDVTVTSASGQVHHETLTVTTQASQIEVDFSKK